MLFAAVTFTVISIILFCTIFVYGFKLLRLFFQSKYVGENHFGALIILIVVQAAFLFFTYQAWLGVEEFKHEKRLSEIDKISEEANEFSYMMLDTKYKELREEAERLKSEYNEE